jgi:hypothetical protein
MTFGEQGRQRLGPVVEIDADALLEFRNAVADLPVPVIARIQGAALGAGFQISVACDLALAAEDALISRWEGPLAGALAPPARIGAALLRIGVFGLRGWLGRDDAYGRDVQSEARGVLGHYRRRWLGRSERTLTQ